MNSSVARWLYFMAQGFRGEPVTRVLRELEQSQRWPIERLRALQWERQRALIVHSFDTVPYYRERWTALGIDPSSLRTPDDWSRLPILEKHEVQAHAERMVSSRAPKGLKAATSGSSGTPVTVYRSHLSWAHAHANVFRAWHWHGLEVGDRYAYLWGLALDRPGRQLADRKDWFFNRERCSAFALDRERARAFYDRLRARPARFALGYPSALTQFAEEVRALGREGRALGWKAAISTAEVLRPHQRETIAEVFGCPVVDSYGCAEAGVAGFECEALSMHVPIESVVVDEIPAEGGQREILLTDLHNYTQPLIRYRVGDLVEPRATVNGAGACACGRALPLLGRPFGRAGDTLELPDGRRMNANQPSYVFKHHGKAGTVREYQFVQFPKSIELRIVPGPAWTDEVRGQLGGEVREALGLEVEIRVVERFERRGRGKHRDFVKAEEIGEG
jgi:phenylacetate-CoA ligase